MLDKIFASIVVGLFSTMVQAQTIVPLIWPFNPGSTQSNYVRALADAANANQKKYQFVFMHKPGAGGAVAARYTLSQQQPHILVNGAGFWTRPLFFNDQSWYDINKFEPLIGMMSDQPVIIHSKKFRSLAELRKQTRVTVGATLGTISFITAQVLISNLPGVQVDIVPYGGTNEITKDVIGDVLDVGIEFPNDLMPWLIDGRTNALGISGRRPQANIMTFRDQNFVGFDDLVFSYFMIVPRELSDSVKTELRQIFREANRDPKVLALYQKDLAAPVDSSGDQLQSAWKKQAQYWKEAVEKANNTNKQK